MEDNPLRKLSIYGQSIWYDDIGRGMLTSGELRRMIEEDGIVGLTSNPTIFQKSISQTGEYDKAIETLVEAGMDTNAIYDALTSQDVAMAADLLQSVYRETGGVDGWVSIEVSPALAYDTEATIAETHRVKKLVDRENLLVKVPATKEGVQAIRRLIAEGVSVNVTLVFSLERYAEVREAYIAGLEELVERRRQGEDLPEPSGVRSVASFFVSRVDTLADQKLQEKIDSVSAGEKERLRELLGKAAIANAKVAYTDFRDTFSGERWETLAGEGAKVQRPLWASTSTKNPEYRDVRYVEELIGPDTVNTAPGKTLEAFRDHGRVAETLTKGADEAQAQLDGLEEAGVSMEAVTSRLEVDGVRAFADSFDELLKTLEDKRKAVGKSV